MPFSAVLDANTLYPFSLRDTLLRLAELELYAPLWSEQILDEMRRNLVERQISAEQADRLTAAMRDAFEEAEVDSTEIERLEPEMTNDRRTATSWRQPSPPNPSSSSPSTSTTSPHRRASPSESQRSTPTTSCSTSTTSARPASGPYSISRPPTSTRPGRSIGSSTRSRSRASPARRSRPRRRVVSVVGFANRQRTAGTRRVHQIEHADHPQPHETPAKRSQQADCAPECLCVTASTVPEPAW